MILLFSLRLFSLMIFGLFPIVTAAEALRDARSACRLRFLTGAAPVIYGVPVYVRR